MATLDVTYDSLRREVGRHLFGDRDPSNWSSDTDKVSDVADAIRRGLASVYFPELPEGFHKWSFLSRSFSMSLQSGVENYPLPDDFSELDAAFVATPDDAAEVANTRKLSPAQEADIRVLAAASPASGIPGYYAIRTSPIETGTLREMVVYPKPNQAMRLTGRYIIEPPTLDSTDNLKPLGGPRLANVFLLACLAAADEKLNPEEGDSTYAPKFQAALMSAIKADQNSYGEPISQPWPVDESLPTDSLEINKAYLKRRVGLKMGHGPNSLGWTHRQSREVEEAVNVGLRTFYNPPILPGDRRSHSWSFLRPLRQLNLVASDSTYHLPDDFVEFIGPLVFAPSSGVMYPQIEVVGAHIVQHRLEQTITAARPTMVAVRVRSTDPAFGTRYEAIFWPVPNESITVSYYSSINPNRLSDDAELPLGGQPHAQAVLEACLYAAETVMPMQTDQKGRAVQSPAYERFIASLAASVSIDRRQSCPEVLGPTFTGDSFTTIPGYEHRIQDNLTTIGGVNLWG